MKQQREIALVYCRRMGDVDNRMSDTKLMWIPGIKPVQMPAEMPKATATKICHIMIVKILCGGGGTSMSGGSTFEPARDLVIPPELQSGAMPD